MRHIVCGVLLIISLASNAENNLLYQFNIKQKTLSHALVDFALITDSNIVFDSTKFDQLVSTEVVGLYGIEQALEVLLSHHPLTYRIDNQKSSLTIYVVATNISEQDPDAVAMELSKVVVRGYVPGDWVYKTPNSDAVVTKEQLDKIPPLHAADLFSEVTGVFVAEDRSSPGLSVNIRGMQDFGRVNMTLDGARQNYQQSGHGANGQAYIDPALIRQVDIKKGPSSRANGAGALGGVVNFTTINADDLMDNDEYWGGRINLTKGIAPDPNGYRLSGSAALGYQSDSFDLMAAYSQKDLDDYDVGSNGGFTGDPVSDKKAQGATAKFTQQDQDSKLFKARYHFDDIRYLAINYNEFNAFTSSDSRNPNNDENTTDIVSRNLIAEFSSPDINARISRTLTRSDQEIYPTSLYSRFDLRYQIETTGATLELKNEFNFASGLLTWYSGGEYFIDETDPKAQQFNFRAAGDFTNSFSGPTPEGKRALGSVFNELQYEYRDWLKVHLGLRYDHYRLQGKTHFDMGLDPDDGVSRIWRAYVVDRDKGAWLPTLSFGYDLIEGLQLFAGYAKGWRPPAITETLLYGQHVGNSGPPVTPNPNLEPEQSNNFEVGLNLYWPDVFRSGDIIKTKAAFYKNKVDDYMINAAIYLPSFGGIGVPGESVKYYQTTGFVNLDKPLTFSGFELKSEYDNAWFYSKLNYTYTDLDFQPSYDPLPNGGSDTFRQFLINKLNITEAMILVQPPAHKTTLDIGTRLLQQRWVMGIRSRYYSANKLAGGPQNELRFRSSKIYDLYSSYQITKDLIVRLTLENATDQLYATPVTLSSSHSGPGRTFLLTVTADF